jgi:hypothetical protein
MKTITAPRLFLLVFLLVLSSLDALTQNITPNIVFRPDLSTYNTTVPPIGPSYQGILYKAYIINNTYPNGTVINTPNCKVIWESTNGYFTANAGYGDPTNKKDYIVTGKYAKTGSGLIKGV